MIIENPDAFKTWLTAILEPLCDADPAALAKYVYALVKKDKPVGELREGMLDQLDVFLQHETKPFVDMLFKSLETMEYLKAQEKLPSPPPEPEPGLDADDVQDNQAPPQDSQLPQPPAGPLEVPPPPVITTSAPASSVPLPAPKSPAPGNVRHRVVVPRGPQAPPRHHQEQTLVKVMPLTELLEEPLEMPRRRDRRADVMRDKEERRRRRSRSWERRARARRHIREPDHIDRSRRLGSRSVSPRGRYRNRSPPPADRAPTRSRSRSPVCARSNARMPRSAERDRMSRDRDHRDRLDRERERSRDRSRERSLSPMPDLRLEHNDGYNKRRCRDFDEKGYCMRGDLCQWDHGADPVVLEDAALTRVLACPPPVPEYNPLAPDIWMGGAFPYPPHPPHPPHLPHMPHPPRELIPIPRIRHEAGVVAPVSMPPRHPAPHKKNFDYNRLGPVRTPSLPPNAANCSLEVKKVPRGLNDITHLNNHFSKFGKIVNIQVSYEGDPERALITFSTPTEASIAYKSTEAVLNNRFIKVFWHNPEHSQQNAVQQHPPPHTSHHKVLINQRNNNNSINRTATAPTTTPLTPAGADNKRLNNIENQNKEANTATNGSSQPKKEVPKAVDKGKQVMEMVRRAQALLHTQLRQQLLLIQRLESGDVTGPQKTALLEAINSSQEGIEKLRKELVAYNKTLRQIQVKKPKTREEAQKEILDAELDMFTKQQEGQDVTELMKKIAELRKQMSIQFPTHPTMRRPHSRGGRFNPSSRFRTVNTNKSYVNMNVVDHRPRALLISGFEPDDLDSLQAHFAQFGEITGKEVNLSVPELTLQYRARAHAELAANNGRNYNDRTLSITWVSNNKTIGSGGSGPAPPPPPPPPAPAATTAANGDANHAKEMETPSEVSEDTLLRFDEEEEDEAEEDRSWRR